MKKALVALICVVVMCATILGGCSLFGNYGESGGKPVPKVEITIQNGSTVKTAEVTPGKKTAIEPDTRKDYYLKGYFDQEQNGTKYIDPAGVSLMEWQSTNPTEFYAQWGSIYDLQFRESPDYILEFGLQGDDVVGVDLGLEIVNAIKGNPEAFVEVTATFKAKGAFKGYEANIWISDKSNKTSGEQIARLDKGLPTSYTEYTISGIVEARIFKNGKMYLYTEHGDFFGMGYAKDVTLTFKFVNEAEKTPQVDSSTSI